MSAIPSTSKMVRSALLAWIHAPLARTASAAHPVFLETTSDPPKMYVQILALTERLSMENTAYSVSMTVLPVQILPLAIHVTPLQTIEL